jgi:DNA-binding GntR family transcriptional regulator
MPTRATTAPGLRAVKRAPSLRDQVYERLREAILTGDLPPGAPLVEAEIAASLSASRTPVREALMRLETEGMIEPRGMRGSVVRELRRDEIDCIFEIREALETLAARRASRRMTDRDAAAFRKLVDRMRTSVDDAVAMARLGTEFHDRILALADGDRLKRMLGDLRADIQPWRAIGLASADRRRESTREHGAMVEAMIAKDEAAIVAVTAQHILNARRAVVAAV